MQVDYIIVGLGLAGLALAEGLKVNQKSFIVFEDCSQNSSLVAGGMYNPVVLKRFTPVWNAEEQLKVAIPFYQQIEKQFGQDYLVDLDIYRSFKSVEEQNNWYEASDRPFLNRYMTTPILPNQNKNVNAPFGFGKLTHTGRLKTKALITAYKAYLTSKGQLKNCKLYYDQINIKDNIEYHGISAKNIVFCEGFGLQQNPFFKYLPLREAKGELLTIHAPHLKIDFLLKSSVFIMPIGNDHYRVGATFNWKDKTNIPTIEARQELVEKLNKVIHCEYRIVDHVAGIRPTVIDRRPMVGKHPLYRGVYVLNGLGTRGVMIAPLMAQNLIDFIENKVPLSYELDIKRFEDKCFNQ